MLVPCLIKEDSTRCTDKKKKEDKHFQLLHHIGQ